LPVVPIGRARRCHFVIAGEAKQSSHQGVIGEAGAPIVLGLSGKAASIAAISLRAIPIMPIASSVLEITSG
jgi:hypothetical protein